MVMNRTMQQPDRDTQSEKPRQTSKRSHTQERPNGRSHAVETLQRSVGNQAVQSLADSGGFSQDGVSPENSLRATRSTGGATERQEERANPPAIRRTSGKPQFQPSLEVGSPADPFEREAERIARAVVRSSRSEPKVTQQDESSTGRIQRMCARCRDRFQQGKPLNCDACETELQRKASTSGQQAVDESTERQIQSVRVGGTPIPDDTRSYFESEIGYDFGDVRVHTGRRADDAARSVNARAFTIGQDVVFRSGEYRPHTTGGKRLLAHELTHVVQQGAATERVGREPSRLHEPRSRTGQGTGEVLARKLFVEEPMEAIPDPTGDGVTQTNAETAQEYLNQLCSEGVDVNPGSGEVTTAEGFCSPIAPGPFFLFGQWYPSPAETMDTPTGCTCVCDMVHSDNEWRIRIDDENWPHTRFDDSDAADHSAPHGTGGIVTAPSPNSQRVWGTATTSGDLVHIDPWLVLGHELCGHAWLGDSGTHAEERRRGEGGHQNTVERENAIREEHGIEARGSFRDPHCGESFWRNSPDGPVEWSRFRDACAAWRDRLNDVLGTEFGIEDRIPDPLVIPWDELEDP